LKTKEIGCRTVLSGLKFKAFCREFSTKFWFIFNSRCVWFRCNCFHLQASLQAREYAFEGSVLVEFLSIFPRFLQFSTIHSTSFHFELSIFFLKPKLPSIFEPQLVYFPLPLFRLQTRPPFIIQTSNAFFPPILLPSIPLTL
jgi:hypothetical protein